MIYFRRDSLFVDIFIVLLYFINRLATTVTGKTIKYNTSKMAFKMMENIGFFLEAIGGYGVAQNDSFQTVDLYEKTNMVQVVNTIHAFGRKVIIMCVYSHSLHCICH